MKIKTPSIYNSCSGKKGTGCDAIDYLLPYGEYMEDVIVKGGDTIKNSCNGSAGCNVSKSYTIPFGTSTKNIK